MTKIFLAFSFFLFTFMFYDFLYAEAVVKEMSFDTDAIKIIWREEGGKLIIVEKSPVKIGEVLPDNCRVCVLEGEVNFDVEGKAVKLEEGDTLDVKDAMARKAQTSYVKVSEGGVAYQEVMEDENKRKPLGEPIPVNKGNVLLRVNDCYSFEELPIPEFEALQSGTSAAVAVTAAPPLPGEEPGTEGPLACASAPC